MPLSAISLSNVHEPTGNQPDISSGSSYLSRYPLLANIISVGQHAEDLPCVAPNSPVSPLVTLAANACATAITHADLMKTPARLDDINNFIHDNSVIPLRLQQPLKVALYHRWKTVTCSDSAWLAQAVAVERVLGSGNCILVAMEHKIEHAETVDSLMMIAAKGWAGRRVYHGADCIAVAEQHGIADDDAFELLEHIAVQGVAAARVYNGEHCETVADEHGIFIDDDAMDVLEMFAVNGVAGQRVANGENCRTVARQQGISLEDKAMDVLEMIAVKGPAGQRVRNGESPHVVAIAHGIKRHSIAMRELNAITPNGGIPAKRLRRE